MRLFRRSRARRALPSVESTSGAKARLLLKRALVPGAAAVLLLSAAGVVVLVRPMSSWAAPGVAIASATPESVVPSARITYSDVPDRGLARAAVSSSSEPTATAEAPAGDLIGFPVSVHTPTTGFGYRSDPFTHLPRFHDGVDLGQPCLDPAWASLDGTVIGAGVAGGYGNRVVLKHADRDGKSFATTYNHLSSITVKLGQQVARGDVVGRIGSTGRSTACHMHFEVIVDGSYVDPLPYLTGQKSTANLSRPVGSLMPTGAATTASPSVSATATASASKTPSASASTTKKTPTPTPSETDSPSATPSPSPAESPSPSPSPSPTEAESPESTDTPTEDSTP